MEGGHSCASVYLLAPPYLCVFVRFVDGGGSNESRSVWMRLTNKALHSSGRPQTGNSRTRLSLRLQDEWTATPAVAATAK